MNVIKEGIFYLGSIGILIFGIHIMSMYGVNETIVVEGPIIFDIFTNPHFYQIEAFLIAIVLALLTIIPVIGLIKLIHNEITFIILKCYIKL